MVSLQIERPQPHQALQSFQTSEPVARDIQLLQRLEAGQLLYTFDFVMTQDERPEAPETIKIFNTLRKRMVAK